MGTDALTNRPFGIPPTIRRTPSTGLLPPPVRQPPRRKAFVSYSHLDQIEANRFVADFAGSGGVFISKMVGRRSDLDRIDSTNTDYVMQRIRSDYIEDSTVTIVLVGTCTHSRRYIDWEIKASLQQGQDNLPNGLVAVQLPSCLNGADLPDRVLRNWSQGHGSGYARYWRYRELLESCEPGSRRRSQRDVMEQTRLRTLGTWWHAIRSAGFIG